MALDPTVGGSTSDSYVTLAEADTYFEARSPSTDWDAATDAEKESALKQAVRRLDVERFRGQTVNPPTGTSSGTTQALAFPRYSVRSREGWTFLHTVIPEPVKRAQMELAYAILSGEFETEETGLEGYSRAKVGPIEVEVRRTHSPGGLPSAVLRELEGLLVQSGAMVRLERA